MDSGDSCQKGPNREKKRGANKVILLGSTLLCLFANEQETTAKTKKKSGESSMDFPTYKLRIKTENVYERGTAKTKNAPHTRSMGKKPDSWRGTGREKAFLITGRKNNPDGRTGPTGH